MASTRTIFAALALAAGSAAAQQDATGVVRDRIDGMKAMAQSAKALGGMLRGFIPFSLDSARAAGREIAAEAEAARGQFPEGSISGPSEALPIIWEERARFDSLLERLRETGARIAAAGDEAAVGTLFAETAEICKDCHARYRKP